MKKSTLTLLTVSYLLLPNLIFLGGWIKPYWAIPAVGVLLFCFWKTFIIKVIATDSERIVIKHGLILLLLAVFFTFISGIGEYMPQHGDMYAHNLLFYDLITQNWAVTYQNQVFKNPYLCYYIAYYLPTAFFAKSLGIEYANEVSFVWGLLGMFLIFSWLYWLGGKYKWWVCAGFVFLGGLYFLTHFTQVQDTFLNVFRSVPIKSHIAITDVSTGIFSNGISDTRITYSSQIIQLMAAPSQAIGGWLATVLLLYWAKTKQFKGFFFVGACTLLWSPFVFIGLLPLGIYVLFQSKFAIFRSSIEFLGIIILLFFVGFYFQGHLQHGFNGWIFEALITPKDIAKYLYFELCQVGFYALIVYWLNSEYKLLAEWKSLFYLSVFTYLVLSFYHFGSVNDWVIRTAIPANAIVNVVLLIILGKLVEKRIFNFKSAIFILFIAMGMYATTITLAHFVQVFGKEDSYRKFRSILNATQDRKIKNLGDNQGGEYPLNVEFWLGEKKSFFGKYLMK
ncbi:hypothetical protein [Runella sp.]|uniref:hypothetical protein n=1 Tax=Runella sp. TaxID=1960881 RepID=UPI002605C5BF|nr:hypothetical protein [Runella sp.]